MGFTLRYIKTIPINPKMLIPDEFELFDIVYILMMQIYETFFKAQNKKTIIFKNYNSILRASSTVGA